MIFILIFLFLCFYVVQIIIVALMFLMDLDNKERNNFKTSSEVLCALIPMVVYYQAVVALKNQIKEHFKDD